MSTVNIAEAKSHFTKLVHRVEQGECVHLSRHGKPVAVLLSETDYQALIAKRIEPYEAMMAWRDRTDFGGDELSDEEIDGWRSREPERAVTWDE
jgi:prevent-host-death family protein